MSIFHWKNKFRLEFKGVFVIWIDIRNEKCVCIHSETIGKRAFEKFEVSTHVYLLNWREGM